MGTHGMEWLGNAEVIAALVTLTTMEIVLGIDNIVFISVLASRLPIHQQSQARVLGLGLAMISRILLLFSITWVMTLTRPWFTIASNELSGRDLILLIGGAFLVWKATREIHMKVEGEEDAGGGVKTYASLRSTLFQIMILDIVFSLDSVITAVGMVDELWVMVTSIVIAVAIMMFFSGFVHQFIEQHPTVKMLALSFLLLIGVVLCADGLGHHINKGYIYSAMAFSVFVEWLNITARSRAALRVSETASVPTSMK